MIENQKTVWDTFSDAIKRIAEIETEARQKAIEQGHENLDELITCSNGRKVPVWQFYIKDAVTLS